MTKKIFSFLLSAVAIAALALVTSALLGVCGAVAVRCYQSVIGT